MHSRLHFQKGDMVAVVAVLLLAVVVFVVFLPKKGISPAYVEIYQEGDLIETLSLDEPKEITLTGRYRNTVTIRDGKAAITHSDCPGTDCVASGWIQDAGRSVVCLPNSVEIRIVGVDSEVDFVVR